MLVEIFINTYLLIIITMVNIEELTIKEAKEKLEEYKELQTVFNIKETKSDNNDNSNSIDKIYIGQKIIVRTYSAGVWFGEITQKAGEEVILKNARRMWYWKAKQSISLSAVAKYGISTESKIAPLVNNVWLRAIELIECSDVTISDIENAPEKEQN